jgi:ISXO2-like transposase domain
VKRGHFGGYVNSVNQKNIVASFRLTRNQDSKRNVVMVARERGGNSFPVAFNIRKARPPYSSSLASPRGTVIHADEAAFWDSLHECFEIKRSSHQEAYSFDGACTNMAEEYFGGTAGLESGCLAGRAAADAHMEPHQPQ